MTFRVLVACEFSGTVREAFRACGADAWSCDLLPAEDGGPHLQGDALGFLDRGWDLMVAHPPCTYLAVSGLHWDARVPERPEKTEAALKFAAALLDAPIFYVCVENPVSVISTRIRPPSQIIQPWQFGANASKRTCLWLKNLPDLRPTHLVEPRMVDGLPRWENQTDDGQNNLWSLPAQERWRERSRTFPGLATAMAEQWMRYCTGRPIAPTFGEVSLPYPPEWDDG